MERPAKRQRTGASGFGEDDNDDELNHEPSEVNYRRDPGLQLEQSRAFAAYKLKSSFEKIFEKYGKDFDGVADEVDLRTGEVLVDNGHLRGLEIPAGDGVGDEPSSDEEERILHGTGDNLGQGNGVTSLMAPRMGRLPQLAGDPWSSPFLGGSHRLSSMALPPRLQFMSSPMAFGSFGMPTHASDPTWSVPDIPSSAFDTDPRQASSLSFVPRKKAARRLLLAPQNTGEDDDEDDILLGTGRHDITSQSASAQAPPAGRKLAESALKKTSPQTKIRSRELHKPDSPSQPSPVKARRSRKSQPADVPAMDAKLRATRAKRQPSGQTHPLNNGSTVSPNTRGKALSGSAVTKTPKSAKPSLGEGVEGTIRRRNSTSSAAMATQIRRSARDRKQTEFYGSLSWTRVGEIESSEQRAFTEQLKRQLSDLRNPPLLHEHSPQRRQPQPFSTSPSSGSSSEVEEDYDDDTPPPTMTPSWPQAAEQVHHKQADAATTAERGHEPELAENAPGGSSRVPTATNLHKPTELFSRNVVDPSYVFSDDEDFVAPNPRPREPEQKSGNYVNLHFTLSSPQHETHELPHAAASVLLSSSVPPLGSEAQKPESPLATIQTAGETEHSKADAPLELFDSQEKELVADDRPSKALEPVLVTLASTRSRRTRLASGETQSQTNIPAQRGVQSELLSDPNPAPVPPDATLSTSQHAQADPEDGIPGEAVNSSLASNAKEQTSATGPKTSKEAKHTQPKLTENVKRRKEPFSATKAQVASSTPPQRTASTGTPAVHTAPERTSRRNPGSPATPRNKTLDKTVRSTPKPASSSRQSIISLVSDDEEDELSLGPDDFTPSGTRKILFGYSRSRASLSSPASSKKATAGVAGSPLSAKRGRLLSSHSKQPQTPTAKRTSSLGVDSIRRRLATGSLAKSRMSSSGGGALGSRGAAAAGSPGSSRFGSPVRTPGGTVRRCGEDGFKCDRDFCFICMES